MNLLHKDYILVIFMASI